MNLDWSPQAPIWLVGCGNMAGAMLRRWLDAGLPREAITVVRPSGLAPAPGVRTLTSLPMGEAPPRLLLLGVKPQKLAQVTAAVAAAIGKETLLVSILAGTGLVSLRQHFPTAGAIVRAMPNMPVAIGRGVVALHGNSGSHRAELEKLMRPLGLVEWIADERAFDVVTALAGSGPAFVFRFVSALAQAAAELGLKPDQAERLAVAMVDGAAGLAAVADEGPGALAERVASPAGVTRRGLDVLDEGGALYALVRRTLEATAERGREMAAEAAQPSPSSTAQKPPTAC